VGETKHKKIEQAMNVDVNKEEEVDIGEKVDSDNEDEDVIEQETAETPQKNVEHIYTALTTRILPRLHKFFTKKVHLLRLLIFHIRIYFFDLASVFLIIVPCFSLIFV